MEYADVIWDNQKQNLINKLENIQLDASRIPPLQVKWSVPKYWGVLLYLILWKRTSLWLFCLSFSFFHFVSSYTLSCDVNLVPTVTILDASNWMFSNLFIDLHVVNSHKHLGVIISDNGQWNDHIDYIVENTYNRLNIMRKFRTFLDRYSLERN
jgi:hypothetical protein